MATKAKIARESKKLRFRVRYRNRCRRCGRPRGYMRKFEVCRICFRNLALAGGAAGRREEQLVGGARMHSDPIADMLTRIRNGMAARMRKVDIPGSKVKVELARILKQEGYVANYRVANDNKKQVLKVYLKYRPDRSPVITRLTRVSKPSRRVYVDSKSIPRVIGGMGVCILTTSRGVMTGRQARRRGVGGEVLCTVY